MKFVSFSVLILSFTFQSHQIVGQNSENEEQTQILSNPFFKIESIREPRQTRVKKISDYSTSKEDNSPSTNTKQGNKTPSRKNNNKNDKSLEKENYNNDDGSYSSSSEESGDSTPAKTGNKSGISVNGSFAATVKKSKLTKDVKSKLLKPRNHSNDDNANTKHNAKFSANASLNLNLGGKGGGLKLNGGLNLSLGGGGGLKLGGGLNLSLGGGGGNSAGGSEQNQEHPQYKQRDRQQGGFYVADHDELDKSLIAGGGSKQNQPHKKLKGEDLESSEEKHGSLTVGASPFSRNKPAMGGILGHNRHINGTHGHNTGFKLPETVKVHKELFNDLSGNSERKRMEKLINKTSVHPFSVERPKNRYVDPNVYSFFQYRPPTSLGFLWSQKAGLGEITPDGGGGIHGGNFLETDNGADIDHLDPANIFDWEFKRYDRACLYVEYLENKAQLNSSQVSEEISEMVDGQNVRLARRFLDWQFINKEDHETIALKGEGENHPHYLTFKFLQITMEIFRERICRNATPYATAPEVKQFAPAEAPLKAEANKKYLDSKLLPKTFVDDLYRLFLALRDITMPRGVPDYATKEDEENIYNILEKCLNRDPIQWFSHTCADQVLSYDEPHNYACTPLVEYDFNFKEYDPIIDGMWHMIASVHAFCYDEFNKISIRFLHEYFMIVVNSFTKGIRMRWKASIAEPKFYVRLLGPDYQTHFETMNRCMFAASLKSGAPYVLPRFLSSSAIAFGKEKKIG